MKRKIIINGGAGFFRSHLAEHPPFGKNSMSC